MRGFEYTLYIDNCQYKEYTLCWRKGCEAVISYEPFYRTLKQRNISTYQLIRDFGVSRSLLDRLKHDKPIRTQTIDDLCRFLDCRVEDILEYRKD